MPTKLQRRSYEWGCLPLEIGLSTINGIIEDRTELFEIETQKSGHCSVLASN